MMSLYRVAVAEIPVHRSYFSNTQIPRYKELLYHTILEIEGCGAFLH